MNNQKLKGIMLLIATFALAGYIQWDRQQSAAKIQQNDDNAKVSRQQQDDLRKRAVDSARDVNLDPAELNYGDIKKLLHEPTNYGISSLYTNCIQIEWAAGVSAIFMGKSLPVDNERPIEITIGSPDTLPNEFSFSGSIHGIHLGNSSAIAKGQFGEKDGSTSKWIGNHWVAYWNETQDRVCYIRATDTNYTMSIHP